MSENQGFMPDRNVSHRIRYETHLKKACPNCGAKEAIVDGETGELCCKHCGLVLREG